MRISQKSQYALRAMLELTLRSGQGPVKISEIAAAQSIPVRFLELILNELKQGGFVDSKRGTDGGYFLVRSAQELSVGEVLAFLEGPVDPPESRSDDPVALSMLWSRVRRGICEVLDTTTFRDLADEEDRRRQSYAPSYSI